MIGHGKVFGTWSSGVVSIKDEWSLLYKERKSEGLW